MAGKKRKKSGSSSGEESTGGEENAGRGNFKYYAASNGVLTGVFNSWLECSKVVIGVKKSQYKGCNSLEKTWEYLIKCGVEPTAIYTW